MLRSNVTCGYLARACSKASGLASTPTTDFGGAGQHGRAVALAAREVDDAATVDALRDPLVDDEVAPVPVVLLRHVGQRALAGEMQRRDAGRLVALDVELGHVLARINTETVEYPRRRSDGAGLAVRCGQYRFIGTSWMNTPLPSGARADPNMSFYMFSRYAAIVRLRSTA